MLFQITKFTFWKEATFLMHFLAIPHTLKDMLGFTTVLNVPVSTAELTVTHDSGEKS